MNPSDRSLPPDRLLFLVPTVDEARATYKYKRWLKNLVNEFTDEERKFYNSYKLKVADVEKLPAHEKEQIKSFKRSLGRRNSIPDDIFDRIEMPLTPILPDNSIDPSMSKDFQESYNDMIRPLKPEKFRITKKKNDLVVNKGVKKGNNRGRRRYRGL